MLQEIQKLDYDRYLSLLFCPKDKREDLLTVILFNLEIARIKARVTEQMIGLIRLQWWREALDEAYDSTRVLRKHDVVTRLRALVNKYKLDKDDFLTIINARDKDLDTTPFQTAQEFNSYVLNTSYPVNKIMLDILGVTDPNIFAATREISQAWAICAIIRSAYKNYGAGRVVFPQDMATKFNVKLDMLGSEEFVTNSKELVKELYAQAESHLKAAKEALSHADKAQKKLARPVLLNSLTVKNHLNQIRKNGYDIFTRTLNPYLGVVNLLKIYSGLI